MTMMTTNEEEQQPPPATTTTTDDDASTTDPPPNTTTANNDGTKMTMNDSSSNTKTNPSTTSTSTSSAPSKKKGPRRIIRRKNNRNGGNGSDPSSITSTLIDPTMLQKVLEESKLPHQVYSFEIVKTVEKIVSLNAQHIALQMPEGLLMYATVLSDVFQRLVAMVRPKESITSTAAATTSNTATTTTTSTPYLRPLQVSILGDVTYGACCVDDLGAKALGCDLLVHYGHSCLVPIQHTAIPCLYVFVEITIDVPHAVQCLHLTIEQQQQQQQNHTNRSPSSPPSKPPQIYLMGTIQFRPALMEARRLLRTEPYSYDNVVIPQAKPLSPGEVLGCTSPVLVDENDTNNNKTSSNGCCNERKASNDQPSSSSCGGGGCHDTTNCNNNDTTADTTLSLNVANDPSNKNNSVVMFIADGRFHLESTMISNPHIPHFYRYDPYAKKLTEERYDHVEMKSIRYDAIQKARSATTFGIILGTLGRQGNPAILRNVQQQIRQANKRSFVMLCSEITPAKLALFQQKQKNKTGHKNGTTTVDAWVQIACPRLSVDWGHFLSQDGVVPVLSPYELFVCLEATEWREKYPMDFYSQQGGPWSNYHQDTKQRSIH